MIRPAAGAMAAAGLAAMATLSALALPMAQASAQLSPSAHEQPAVQHAARSAGSLTITVTDLRSSKGVVRACMTRKRDVFPRCIRDPQSHRTIVPAGAKLAIRFDDVAPGRYAIALLHDENGNGKADRALGMMPREGYGFSRDAEVRMGPPEWDDAVFEHGAKSQAMAIRMRYFL